MNPFGEFFVSEDTASRQPLVELDPDSIWSKVKESEGMARAFRSIAGEMLATLSIPQNRELLLKDTDGSAHKTIFELVDRWYASFKVFDADYKAMYPNEFKSDESSSVASGSVSNADDSSVSFTECLMQMTRQYLSRDEMARIEASAEFILSLQVVSRDLIDLLRTLDSVPRDDSLVMEILRLQHDQILQEFRRKFGHDMFASEEDS